MDNTSERSNT